MVSLRATINTGADEEVMDGPDARGANQKTTMQKNAPRLMFAYQRNSCYDDCPSYTLDVYSDGKVIYNGRSGVVQTGVVEKQVSQEAIAALTKQVKAAQYFSLSSTYPSPAIVATR